MNSPVPSREELVGRARSLHQLLSDSAQEGEAAREITGEVHKGLTDAGLFRMFVPTRFGGYEASMRTVLEVTEALGSADASAAWLVSVGSVAAWIAGQASPRGQEELFASGPDVHIAGGNAPVLAERVPGGLRMSGRWSYASGAGHARWASLGAAVRDQSGEVVDAVLGFVPASVVRLERTWQSIGMRGTGSDTWVAEDVFVPEHLTVSMGRLGAGDWRPPSDEPMYGLPLAPVATVPLLGPILGAAQAALDLVVRQAPGKTMQHTFFSSQSESVGVQIQVAEAAVKLRTARLHAADVADVLDDSAGRHRVGYSTRARMRAQTGLAAQLACDALDVLLTVHGSGGFSESNPLQRRWRDVNTAARHAALNPVIGYEVYGKDLLGIGERISPSV
ncbi:acyl-CoA dehydrogenase family protein [Lentzea sp. NPDC058450]|uniref:acyl-CoA dehydrogenase family protein n=1 Tax=Lentzea sp. NPDC058450 TaxID=3346505 RepID=UPI00365FF21A